MPPSDELSGIRNGFNGSEVCSEKESEPTSSLSHEAPPACKGELVPNPYALAEQLANPVVRGYLPAAEAMSAILVAALRYGRATSYEPRGVFRLCRHLFDLRAERLEIKRAVTEMRIKRRLKPLIAMHKPSNVLLAEAHDVNGTDGFPLDEPEVAEIAHTEMYWSLPRQGRRP